MKPLNQIIREVLIEQFSIYEEHHKFLIPHLIEYIRNNILECPEIQEDVFNTIANDLKALKDKKAITKFTALEPKLLADAVLWAVLVRFTKELEIWN